MKKIMNKKSIGRVTLPMAEDIALTDRIISEWGADAIRDCDGTDINDGIIALGKKVYKTYFVTRGDNAWANIATDEKQHFFVMSMPVTAKSDTLDVDILQGYFAEQIEPDALEGLSYWQVIDRTSGAEIENWRLKGSRVVTFKTVPFHIYTVSFMASIKWDSTQMYNYITNNWDKEKETPYDPRYEKTEQYIQRHLSEWLQENPGVDVVRFTTFLYHFTLLFNDKRKEKYVDWFGYSATVSPLALEAFKERYGYSLVAEDFVDDGYYNSPFRNPSKAYLDYIDFTQNFVSQTAKKLVEIVHSAHREAMMFLGDTWIGAEPYGKHFASIGLDAVVGSIGGGVTVRMLTDIPSKPVVEGRFLPYFFPDTFYEGNDPTIELNKNWLTARRAMLRKPLDRIGYGGYLSLASKFPKFVDRVAGICDEFRLLYDNIHAVKPYSGVKVAILNAWGALRSWQSHMVAHELWYQQIYSYQGVLEALSGLAVEVSFMSFDDVINNGVDKNIDVIINVGDAGTSFSGGEYWKNAELITTIRKWVSGGGGFIGIGEPTACLYGGRFFQLSDVLGVDKEVGFSLSSNKYNIVSQSHFITADSEQIDYGEGMKNIYAHDSAKVLDIKISARKNRNVNVGEVMLATNDYDNGKGVYIAGLPYSSANARLLYRALYYASGKEKEMYKAFSTNLETECNYYQAKKLYALVNNSDTPQKTVFYDIDGNKQDITLDGMEVKWIK